MDKKKGKRRQVNGKANEKMLFLSPRSKQEGRRKKL